MPAPSSTTCQRHRALHESIVVLGGAAAGLGAVRKAQASPPLTSIASRVRSAPKLRTPAARELVSRLLMEFCRRSLPGAPAEELHPGSPWRRSRSVRCERATTDPCARAMFGATSPKASPRQIQTIPRARSIDNQGPRHSRRRGLTQLWRARGPLGDVMLRARCEGSSVTRAKPYPLSTDPARSSSARLVTGRSARSRRCSRR